MGKFNYKTKSTTETTNYEGGRSFKHKDIQSELYARVSTCLVKEPKFYGDADEEFETIVKLVQAVLDKEPEFVLQLASYARNTLHLRSIPVVLLGLASFHPEGRKFVRRYTPDIIRRADELSEVLAFVQECVENIGDETEGTMIPMSLTKGLRDSFPNFNEYQFSKYDKNNARVSLQDVIRLVHPKPKTPEQNELFRKIAKDELKPADTWEVLISGKGSTKETWEAAIPKMPIMATLRNLRNVLDNNVNDDSINFIINKLTDEQTILNSKQFPFRFLSALRSIEDNDNFATSSLLTALDTAITISVMNIPVLSGRTAVFCDVSGSMAGTISDKSSVLRADIGALLGAIASIQSQNNIVLLFDDHLQVVNFSQNDSILNRTAKILKRTTGGATYGHLPFDYLVQNNIKVDRILLFSDMQCYNANANSYGANIGQSWNNYKQSVNPNTYLYSFDLAGYGTTQVPERDPRVLTIAGWSEAILKYIPIFESDKQTVLAEIRKITPKHLYKE